MFTQCAALCRWFGFADKIIQRVPCYHNLNTLHPDAVAALADTPLRLPPGYLATDDGSQGIRQIWTPEAIETDPKTWVTDGVLKYSQLEMEARGATGEEINQQVCLLLIPANAV